MKLKLAFFYLTLLASTNAIESRLSFYSSNKVSGVNTSFNFAEEGDFKVGDKIQFSVPDYSMKRFSLNLSNMAVTCNFVLDGKLIAKDFSPCFCARAEWRYFTNYMRNSDAWYAQGEYLLEVECTVKEVKVFDIDKYDVCKNFFKNQLSDDYSDKTIFWYEESKELRFATDYFWLLIPIQVLADILFAFSFIFNDFFACTGLLSYLTSAILSNFWFMSAAIFDTSIRKYLLAGFNITRNLIFLLYNDFGCQVQPNWEFPSTGKLIYQPENKMILVQIALALYNFYPAMQYFFIDDFLSSKMAWVLASNSVAHLVGFLNMLI